MQWNYPCSRLAQGDCKGWNMRCPLFVLWPTKLSCRFIVQRSYLKAAIGDPQAHVVSTEDEHVLVDVTFPVHPGEQYKVSGLEIAGCKALPADTLRSLIHVKAGETANTIQLEKDLEAVKQVYGTRGYVAANVRRGVETRRLAAYSAVPGSHF